MPYSQISASVFEAIATGINGSNKAGHEDCGRHEGYAGHEDRVRHDGHAGHEDYASHEDYVGYEGRECQRDQVPNLNQEVLGNGTRI